MAQVFQIERRIRVQGHAQRGTDAFTADTHVTQQVVIQLFKRTHGTAGLPVAEIGDKVGGTRRKAVEFGLVESIVLHGNISQVAENRRVFRGTSSRRRGLMAV